MLYEEAYYTLHASLPALAPPFAEERPPISRIALERKLAMLSSEDAEQLNRIESVMFFDRLSWELTDEAVVAKAEAVLASIRDTELRDVAQWRLSVRTAVAAVRRRKAGLAAPDRKQRWGVGPWTDVLRRNWARDDFGLSAALPWFGELRRMLDGEQADAVERFLLLRVWDHISRVAFHHRFSFAAVVLYVLRWDLVQRASRQDSEQAQRRFRGLLDSSLKGLELAS
ncbi:MAG: DUF2764 family protein [Myxococcota bacterium]